MKKLIWLLLSLLVFLTGCGMSGTIPSGTDSANIASPATDTPASSLQTDVFTANNGHFSIEIPKGWAKHDQSSETMPVTTWTEEKSNVSIMAAYAPTPKGLDLNKFAAGYEANVKSNLPEDTKFSQKQITVDGVEGVLIEVTSSVGSDVPSVFSALFMTNGTTYINVCTADAGDFEKWRDTFMYMINSIKFK